MEKKKHIFAAGLFVVASLVGLANCEIGLGPQIDTDTPTVSITAPSIGSSLKQTITVEGICNDDNGVQTINVSLRDSDGKSHAVGTITVGGETKWTIDIDTSDYPDATYEIVAEAFDASKRHSSATRSVNIDNTPPVVLLSRPNSLTTSEIDAGVYGGTVTLAGEILDDHDITALYIRAYDESGAEIVLSGERVKIDEDDDDTELWQKWTGFDVQGGVSLTIAQYAASEPAGEKERLLAENFNALFNTAHSLTSYVQESDAAFSSTVLCQLVVVAIDESGNRSTCSYIKSSLNDLVSEKTGIPSSALKSTKYKTIANGTCPVDDVFTAARQQKIRDILANIGDYDVEYASSAEGNKLAFSICPQSAPKYEISGFSFVAGGEFASTSSMGTLPLVVKYGLDKYQILPDSLTVTLYECDDSGAYAADATPLFTTVGAAKPGADATEEQLLQWQSIYWVENEAKRYTRESSTTVDEKTYTIQLPVLKSNKKVRVIIGGEDEAENQLIPQDDAVFAFQVASTEAAPRVDGNDQTYYSKSGIAGASIELAITDTTGEFEEADKGSITVTPTLYAGHYLKTNYASASGATKGAAKTYTINSTVSGSRFIEKNSDTSFTAAVPLKPGDYGLTLGSEDNYTVVYEVTVANGTTATRKETKSYVFWVDCAAPVIELSNPWTQDAGSTVTPNSVYETSAYWNKMTYAESKEQDGITDIIALNGLDAYITDDTYVNVYSIRGYWSDSAGSGTNGLYFQVADNASALDLSTALDEDFVPTGSQWIKIDTANTTAGATNRFAITNAQLVREGTGTAIAFFAVDNVGNVSGIYQFSKLIFDFATPALTMPDYNQYYGSAQTEDIVFTLSASDSNAMSGISVTAYKDGVAVTSGTNGYTFAQDAAVARTGTATGYEAAAKLFDASLVSTQEATIRILPEAAANGKWTFSAQAADVNGRQSGIKTFSTVIDTIAPVVSGTPVIDRSSHSDDASWYKNGTLRVEGAFTEAVSGIDSVYYAVLSSKATAAQKTALEAAVSAGDITSLGASGKVIVNADGSASATPYTITPTGFELGDNMLYVQAVDKAGNKSAVTAYVIRLDQTSPELGAGYYTFDGERYESASGTVYANKESALTIYGTVSDANSGVADFAGFVIGGTDVSATFTYSTEEIEDGDASQTDEVRAAAFKEWLAKDGNADSFVAYDAANATEIRSWKAVLNAADLVKGAVKLTAKDIAANTMPQTFFTLSIDTQLPAATLTSHTDGATLNGTVDFSGTSSDDTAVRTVSLYYSYTSDAATITADDTLVTLPDGSSAVLSDSNAYNWEFEALPVTYYDANGDMKLFGGTAYEGSAKDVHFKLKTVDIAGNSSVKVYTFSLDPAADRPAVTLSNLKSDGTTLLKSSDVYGSISDDDGTVQGVWIIESGSAPESFPTTSANNGWTKLTVSNGGFTATASSGDGAKSWWLYVIDGAGGTFTTAYTGSETYASLKRPVLSFTDSVDLDVSGAITFRVDTVPPEIKEMKLSRADTGTAAAAGDYAAATDDSGWFTANNTPFGGTKNVLYVRFTVEESTGMSTTQPVSLIIDRVAQDVSGKVAVSHDTGSNTYIYTVGPFAFDKDSFADGTKAVAVTVRDEAGTSAQLSKSIVVDNSAPEVSFEYPTTSEAISTAVDVVGSVSDGAGGAGVQSVKWMIPTKAQVAAGVTADTDGWLDRGTTGTSTFSIAFDSLEKDDEKCILHYANETYTDQSTTQKGRWNVPFYFLVTDNLGNQTIDTTHYVVADTDSGLPTAIIIYPENKNIVDGEEKSVGGMLTVYGSATDDVEVTEVRVQLDVNGDGEFTDADYNELMRTSAWTDEAGTHEPWATYDAESGKYFVYGYELIYGTDNEDNPEWYIKAGGTSSWSLTIETKKVMYKTDSEDENYVMHIRARAYDAQNNSRGWHGNADADSEKVEVTIDKNVPVIGTLYVTGYRDGEQVVSRQYTDGMYISGADTTINWYLEAELTDDTGVASAEFSEISGYETISNGTVTLNGAAIGSYTPAETATFKAQLPVSATSSQIYTTLTVFDEGEKDTSQNIRINIDSIAPSLYTTNNESVTTTEDLRLVSSGKNISAENFIQNSNGIYTLGDTVTEDGSGLAYIAVYFKRFTAGSTTAWRVYNPMFSGGETNANRTDKATSFDINGDGLAVQTVTGTRSAPDSFTAAALDGNGNIRVGGLVKLGGTYCLIQSVSGDTVTFSPTVPETYTTAEFVYAQVVDHLAVEGPTNGDYTTVKNDDNDGMVESLRLGDGGAYSWSASVFSNYIPDGPIEVHVVAIDKAGNISHGSCTTNVYNNPPRIAKVLLGTELSGNGEYDFNAAEGDITLADSTGYVSASTANGRKFGEFVYYSTLDADNKAQDSAQITVKEGDWFVVKDGMLLLPEFVGGNTSLSAIYTIADKAPEKLSAYTAGAAGTISYGTLYSQDATKTLAPGATDHISKFGSFYLNNDTLKNYESKESTGGTVTTTAKYVTITFWDATEEKTQGKDSQYALLSFPIVVDITDDITPETEIDPFYWADAADNSVYKNAKGALQGHIELESDWKQSDKYKAEKATAGVYDGDPKVSGMIRITGTASDDTKLGTLSFSFDGMQLNSQTSGAQAVLATFTNGEWEFSNGTASGLGTYDADTKTWSFEGDNPLAKVETAGWSLAVMDAEGVTQSGHTIFWELDIDTQKLSGYAGADKSVTVYAADATGNGANVAYRMDVVPYVTGVTTSLSSVRKGNPSVFSRTALGHYPVYITYAGDLEDNYTKATYESVTLGGYNLTGATVTTAKATNTKFNSVGNTATLDGNLRFTLPQAAASGELSVTVGGIPALNNLNYDDSCGSYDYTAQGYTAADIGTTGNKAIYANYYNRQPNGANNNNLTDNIYLDVWQFNSKAAMPRNNSALDVMMKVNPVSKMINFAFCSGDLYFSMANGTENSYTGKDTTQDFFQCTSLGIDKNGVTFATAASGESGSSKAGQYFFYSSGRATTGIGTIAVDNYDNMAKDRFKSPSIVSDGTNVYLAYFDLLGGDIFFKYGKVSDTTTGTLKTDFSSQSSIKTSHANEQNLAQVVADGDGHALGYAGEYVSLGVTSKGYVVMAWYDSTKKNLMFSYNTTPSTKRTGVSSAGWSEAKPLLTGSGKYCQVAVDSADGIHIAAFNSSSGDLEYVYIPSSTNGIPQVDSKKTCKVDTYQSTGKEITIDVAKVGNYQIPSIGYCDSSKRVKYAYLADPAAFYGGTTKDGATSDFYTGTWECSVVPTTSTVNSADTVHRINVALWKNGGVLASSTDAKSEASESKGNCYGNGTSNAVLGYSIEVGLAGYVETAQKR